MRHTVATSDLPGEACHCHSSAWETQWQVAARIASEHNATRRASCHALTRLATIDQLLLLLLLLLRRRSAVDRVDCRLRPIMSRYWSTPVGLRHVNDKSGKWDSHRSKTAHFTMARTLCNSHQRSHVENQHDEIVILQCVRAFVNVLCVL